MRHLPTLKPHRHLLTPKLHQPRCNRGLHPPRQNPADTLASSINKPTLREGKVCRFHRFTVARIRGMLLSFCRQLGSLVISTLFRSFKGVSTSVFCFERLKTRCTFNVWPCWNWTNILPNEAALYLGTSLTSSFNRTDKQTYFIGVDYMEAYVACF